MIEWAQDGRNILSKGYLPQQEREQMEHFVALAEFYGNLVGNQAVDSTLPTPELAAQTPESLLRQAVQEYKADPQSAEALTQLNRTFYDIMSRKIGLEITVPDCDWSRRKIRKSMPTVEGKTVDSLVLCYPQELRGKEGLVRIGKMFGLGNWSVKEDTPVISETIPAVWTGIEKTIDAPNGDTREDDLAKHAKRHNLFGQDLNLYLLGSRFIKLLKGGYFDQGSTWSRVPASRREGRLLDAYCDSDGDVHVHSDLVPGNRSPDLGARFARV